ncbi:hypothetical protein [Brevibacillus sedimenti]|jgi:hypothetical protein|uniref:hypothetical protein n=1 Tax=Brevibacillus sedimenti TaxID=2613334 RepID=UPI001E3436D6|nr:hypothetical protein [Anoxybacillus sediminis]UFJ62283.1 hypothetical protein IRT44_05610 [Anoxybacillus sediminis]
MKSHQYFGNWPVLNKVGLDCMLLSPVCQITPFLEPNNRYQPSKKLMANGSTFVSSSSVERNGIVRHMDYGMQEKTAGEPGLAENTRPPAGKTPPDVRNQQAGIGKKALLRCADARSQKGFCHNNEL